MQRAREQLLAGPALALEQHGRIGGRRPVQRQRDLLQPRVFSDDLGRAAALGELLFEQEVLRRQPPLRQRPLDEEQQVIGIDRLGEKVERPFLHRRDGVLDVAERGHHDDRQLGVQILRGAQHAETVALGQPEIGEHHGGAHGLERRHRLGLIPRFDDGVPLRLEGVTQHRPAANLCPRPAGSGDRVSDGRARSPQPAGRDPGTARFFLKGRDGFLGRLRFPS